MYHRCPRIRSLLGGIAIGLAISATGRSVDLNESIQTHRMGTIVIEGKPGARVRVEQMRHEFWFGAAIASHMFHPAANPDAAENYRKVFLDNFNAAVTENALKWYAMERQKGEIHTDTVDAILDWTHRNEIPLRGHCIFWGVPRFIQDWIKELDDQELEETIRRRAVDVSRRYEGKFVEYDLNNEMMHTNYYEDRLGKDITLKMAQWVKQGDPDAVLFVNDFDVLTGKEVDRFVAHVRKLLDEGVPVEGIGLQGHCHGLTFDRDAVWNALDAVGELGLPIRVTEFNVPGQKSPFYLSKDLQMTPEQEKIQAKELEDYYRICFAHPAVTGILMWGFWEDACWIPASAIYRRDWSPRPAALAYRRLVFEEWWTDWEGEIGEKGRCDVKAFHGEHRVTVDGKETIVELKKGQGSVTLNTPWPSDGR